MNNVPVLSAVQSNLSLKFNLSKYQWNAIRVLLSCYHCAIYFDYWWRFHSGAFGEIGVCASISCLQMSDPSVSPPILSPATKNQALDNIAAEDLHLAEHFSCSSRATTVRSLSSAAPPCQYHGGGCWKKGYWNYQSGRTVTLSSVSSSAGTLLWIYRRLIGRSYITLARQDQYIGNISDWLGRLRSWLFLVVVAVLHLHL